MLWDDFFLPVIFPGAHVHRSSPFQTLTPWPTCSSVSTTSTWPSSRAKSAWSASLAKSEDSPEISTSRKTLSPSKFICRVFFVKTLLKLVTSCKIGWKSSFHRGKLQILKFITLHFGFQLQFSIYLAILDTRPTSLLASEKDFVQKTCDFQK